MVFSLFVPAAPAHNTEQSTALLTAKAMLAAGHQVYRVFFYAEGVRHYDSGADNTEGAWQVLAAGTATDLCFCSGSVKKYAVALVAHANVSQGGLVQLLDAQMSSDRVVCLS